MILYNVNIVGEDEIKHIHVKDGIIKTVTSNIPALQSSNAEIKIDAEGALCFPGLINSHDHLEFNLFPQLGNKIYANYVEWGDNIHKHNQAEINAVLKIPASLRIQWGIYKNLLNGIITVVHHGNLLQVKEPLIDVFQNCYSLHSVQLHKNWKVALNNPFKHKPYAIHIGEGTDKASAAEIDELIHWNFFKKKLIGIHGVAMNSRQAKYFKALTWCPVSNYFLLNKTADINELKKQTNIIFGTDSTLTATWNIWQHLRFARELKVVTDEALIDMLTTIPAKVWQLKNTGTLALQHNANMVIAKKPNGISNIEAFFVLNPQSILMVIKKGEILLFDEALLPQISNTVLINKFYKISINGDNKFIAGDLPALIKEIWKHHPSANFPVSI